MRRAGRVAVLGDGRNREEKQLEMLVEICMSLTNEKLVQSWVLAIAG